MYGAFGTKADYTPFRRASQPVPLTRGGRHPTRVRRGHPRQKKGSAAKKVAAGRSGRRRAGRGAAAGGQWQDWGNQQHFTGNGAVPDYAHPSS